MSSPLATSETAAAKLQARARWLEPPARAETRIPNQDALRGTVQGVRFCGRGGQ
jgi:hypothetical protein